MREKESEEVFLSMFRALLLLGFLAVVMFLLLISKIMCFAHKQISWHSTYLQLTCNHSFFSLLARMKVENHLTKSEWQGTLSIFYVELFS